MEVAMKKREAALHVSCSGCNEKICDEDVSKERIDVCSECQRRGLSCGKDACVFEQTAKISSEKKMSSKIKTVSSETKKMSLETKKELASVRTKSQLNQIVSLPPSISTVNSSLKSIVSTTGKHDYLLEDDATSLEDHVYKKDLPMVGHDVVRESNALSVSEVAVKKEILSSDGETECRDYESNIDSSTINHSTIHENSVSEVAVKKEILSSDGGTECRDYESNIDSNAINRSIIHENSKRKRSEFSELGNSSEKSGECSYVLSSKKHSFHRSIKQEASCKVQPNDKICPVLPKVEVIEQTDVGTVLEKCIEQTREKTLKKELVHGDINEIADGEDIKIEDDPYPWELDNYRGYLENKPVEKETTSRVTNEDVQENIKTELDTCVVGDNYENYTPCTSKSSHVDCKNVKNRQNSIPMVQIYSRIEDLRSSVETCNSNSLSIPSNKQDESSTPEKKLSMENMRNYVSHIRNAMKDSDIFREITDSKEVSHSNDSDQDVSKPLEELVKLASEDCQEAEVVAQASSQSGNLLEKFLSSHISTIVVGDTGNAALNVDTSSDVITRPDTQSENVLVSQPAVYLLATNTGFAYFTPLQQISLAPCGQGESVPSSSLQILPSSMIFNQTQPLILPNAFPEAQVVTNSELLSKTKSPPAKPIAVKRRPRPCTHSYPYSTHVTPNQIENPPEQIKFLESNTSEPISNSASQTPCADQAVKVSAGNFDASTSYIRTHSLSRGSKGSTHLRSHTPGSNPSDSSTFRNESSEPSTSLGSIGSCTSQGHQMKSQMDTQNFKYKFNYSSGSWQMTKQPQKKRPPKKVIMKRSRGRPRKFYPNKKS
ncbi:hypothetical protein SK128_017467 [Halocaridina rubra]|uniref:Uncharacterized protein n=1 Tax=Halocaridina rubra TaxID=373956 RepID=A0AAN9A5W0_HALRR